MLRRRRCFDMKKNVNKIKQNKSDVALNIVFYVLMGVFALMCVYPFYQVLVSSFADENTLISEGYRLIPSKFSLDAYRTIFANDVIPRAYLVTVFITVAGTALSLVVTGLAAYALSGGKLKYRNVLLHMLVFGRIGGKLLADYQLSAFGQQHLGVHHSRLL